MKRENEAAHEVLTDVCGERTSADFFRDTKDAIGAGDKIEMMERYKK
jgi:hypothetical protein